MTSRTVADVEIAGCRKCGRVWLAADDLERLLRVGREALLAVAHAFPAEGEPRPGAIDPPCPDCGAPLAEHAVAGAPGMALPACAACRRVLLTAGQAAALAERPAPQAEAATSRWRWPKRPDGTPYLSWFVFGMPMWAALLALLLAAMLLPHRPAPGHFIAPGGRRLMVGLDGPTLVLVALLLWPLQAALFLVTFVGDRRSLDAPSLSDLFVLPMWRVMLRVVACADLAAAVLCRVCPHSGLAKVAVAILWTVVWLVMWAFGIQKVAPD